MALGSASALVICFLAAHGARADEGTEPAVQITSGADLEWGVKQSWRGYVGPPESASDGASVIPAAAGQPYQIGWKFDSGAYDAAVGMTVLRYRGTVHWLKYPGTQFPGLKPPSYDGPMDVNILDVTVSDPVVTISATESTISADVSSRSMDTWEIEDFDAAQLATLDVGGLAPVVADGVTTWTGIPTASGADAAAAFSGNYREGTAFDPLSFAYTGPGGAPDVSERWDEPGSSPLSFEANTIVNDDGINKNFRTLLIDREHRVIVFYWNGASGLVYQAFGLDEMKLLGEPLSIQTGTPNVLTKPMFYDSNRGRLYFEAAGKQVRWLEWDRGEKEWHFGVVEQPFPLAGIRQLMWDSVGRRAFNFVRFKPEGVANNDYDSQRWQLNTYSEEPDGSWVRQTYDLPNGPACLNKERYPTTSPLEAPRGIGASDGSLIVLGVPQTSNCPEVSAPATAPGAYRIRVDEEDGTADVRPISGTEFDNTASPSQEFTQVLAGMDRQVVLTRQDGAGGAPARLQNVEISGDGTSAAGEASVLLPGVETAGPVGFAVDQQDGTIWVGGNWSQRIIGVRDGRVIDNQYFPERHPRGGPVMVGQDHAVYAQTNDGSPAGFGGSALYGIGRFERLGISPGVAEQPASQTVSLGLADASREVVLHSAATGTPAPTPQWQIKAVGSTRFVDLEDETGPDLALEAIREDNGAEYRAVYRNAAGRIATDPARLTVEYAPRLTTDLANVSVVAGTDATFRLAADANPGPTVTWQRRVGGYWQSIAADDDNFDASGTELTVLNANTEQSGSLFRAKLTNAVTDDAGTPVYSRTAKLTVSPATEIPPEGLDLDQVSLEWTGNAEMQGNSPAGTPNYFSAGVSRGDEATYTSVAGDAAVYQVTAAGGESLATWATRGAHTSNGGSQLVRLYGGHARIEPDGEATVQWDGSFSANFYGGMVPFTFTDPELAVDADGTGTLRAEMSGCEGNMENPLGGCPAFPPVPEVTVATFSGVEVDPSGKVEIAPDYAGVEVDDVDPTRPQVRSGTGWGSWPPSFVAFHVRTGLAAYWYSSGGFDDAKAPAPFTVDFRGGRPPAGPPAEAKPPAAPPPGQGPPQGGAQPGKPLRLTAFKRTQRLGANKVARLATLACPPGGACRVSAPQRVRVRLGGRRYPLAVLAPKRIGAGRKATLRLRFPAPALRALAKRKRATTVELRVKAGAQPYQVRVMLRRAARGKVRVVHVGVRKVVGPKAGGPVPHEPSSAPISGEPPLLQRPPTAVDVSGVRITWYPRDSWLRYASSGVAPGDGIRVGGGATGADSTASACPDRESNADAQLPYAISFTPQASWYDPPSGMAGIYGQGSVGFRWRAHTIDLTASDPEIEINGAASRAIFRFSGSEGTPYPNQRADLLSLDRAGRPTVSGKTLTYDLMRGTLTPNGVNVFAGFYTPPTNDEFGCVSVSFTLP